MIPTQHPHLSIVSPVYKAENIIRKLVEEIQKTMFLMNCTYEIILVDDRSPDDCWKVMKQLAQTQNIKCIRLSKNFGENCAIIAGLSHASGDWIVVLDCDLQDQPKEIIKLYEKTKQGYDMVLASRENRKDSFFKKQSSKLFSKVFGFLTDTKYNNKVNNFGIYSKKVIQSVLKVSDNIKFFPLFVSYVGYESITIPVDHANRDEGKSSYTIKSLLILAFNVLLSFSNKPLLLFVKFGLLISFMSIIVGFEIFLEYLRGQNPKGYSSLIVSIWFLAGINITIVGIVGIYVGKIFDQAKGREPFIIDEILN